MLSCSAIFTCNVSASNSAAVSRSLKLINLPPRSHIDTVSARNGSCAVMGTMTVAVASSVGETVGEGDGNGLAGGTVEVGWGTFSQYLRSKSPFERDRDGSPSKRSGPTVPSGQV